MTVKLLSPTVKLIESKQSKYGCGAWDCLSCYPIQYACDECGIEFSAPVFRTDLDCVYVCKDCDWLRGYDGVRLVR